MYFFDSVISIHSDGICGYTRNAYSTLQNIRRTKKTSNKVDNDKETIKKDYIFQKASASPPYRFGSSLSSMIGDRAAFSVGIPLPTTLILATVFADNKDLKIQKTQVMNEGTLTKNFFAWNKE
jgi:hypothetical protein